MHRDKKKEVEESTPSPDTFFVELASATEGIASIDRQKQAKVHAMRCENPLFSIIPFSEGVFFDFKMFSFCSVTYYYCIQEVPMGVVSLRDFLFAESETTQQLTGTLCMYCKIQIFGHCGHQNQMFSTNVAGSIHMLYCTVFRTTDLACTRHCKERALFANFNSVSFRERCGHGSGNPGRLLASSSP